MAFGDFTHFLGKVKIQKTEHFCSFPPQHICRQPLQCFLQSCRTPWRRSCQICWSSRWRFSSSPTSARAQRRRASETKCGRPRPTPSPRSAGRTSTWAAPPSTSTRRAPQVSRSRRSAGWLAQTRTRLAFKLTSAPCRSPQGGGGQSRQSVGHVVADERDGSEAVGRALHQPAALPQRWLPLLHLRHREGYVP